MRIKAAKDDMCELHLNVGFEDFCRDMEWEVFTPPGADFVHEGWRISIEQEISEGVYAPMSKPWMRISQSRKAKLEQRYTPSLRRKGRTCGDCIFHKEDACKVGGFKVKTKGGCNKFKGRKA